METKTDLKEVDEEDIHVSNERKWEKAWNTLLIENAKVT